MNASANVTLIVFLENEMASPGMIFLLVCASACGCWFCISCLAGVCRDERTARCCCETCVATGKLTHFLAWPFTCTAELAMAARRSATTTQV